MDELALIAIAGAAAGAATVLVFGPVRRRVVPVTKAAGSAGLGLAGATLHGIDGIARALITGQAPGERPKEGPSAPEAA